MILKERGLIDLDRPDQRLPRRREDQRPHRRARGGHRADGRESHRRPAAALPVLLRGRAVPRTVTRRNDPALRQHGDGAGERYHYSNLGYGILDYVISRVSGKSYRDFMRTEVFVPLGLTHMSVDLDARAAEAAGGALRHRRAADSVLRLRPSRAARRSTPARTTWSGSAMFHVKSHLSDQKPILSDARDRRHAEGDRRRRATVRATASAGRRANIQAAAAACRTPAAWAASPRRCDCFPAEKIVIVVLTNAGSHPVAGHGDGRDREDGAARRRAQAAGAALAAAAGLRAVRASWSGRGAARCTRTTRPCR